TGTARMQPKATYRTTRATRKSRISRVVAPSAIRTASSCDGPAKCTEKARWAHPSARARCTSRSSRIAVPLLQHVEIADLFLETRKTRSAFFEHPLHAPVR